MEIGRLPRHNAILGFFNHSFRINKSLTKSSSSFVDDMVDQFEEEENVESIIMDIISRMIQKMEDKHKIRMRCTYISRETFLNIGKIMMSQTYQK